MRIDKWIWAVRMVKSRTIASELCKKNKVYLNDKHSKPAKSIEINDIVEVEIKNILKKYKVTGFLEKRVGAEQAKEFYEEIYIKDKKQSSMNSIETASFGVREKGDGRPTKKNRRQINEFKQLFQ